MSNDEIDRLRLEYGRRAERFAGSDIYLRTNPANLFMVQQRQKALVRIMRETGISRLDGRRILEIGCGSGGVLLEFLEYGADPELLHGIDLLEDRIAEARRLLPLARLVVGNAQHLPDPDGHFDVILQFTAFSSILDSTIKADMAREMLRVLKKPFGVILWYDFWVNPTNPQTRGIRPSEIRSLFPGCRYRFHRVTLAPPLARRLVPIFWVAAELLEKIKLLNTHYLVAIRPESAS
jgi:SAM-dependent methyltransferase